MFKTALAASSAALLLAGCATTSTDADLAAKAHPEARAYAVSDNAMSDVDGALIRAGENGKHVLLVMGANWCHDSRALAGWLETPRFAQLVERDYELVFVNVGMPQTGDGHNLSIARRFGLEELPGTPNLLVLTADGRTVNAETATTWRNAASRSEDAIYDELVALAQATVPTAQ